MKKEVETLIKKGDLIGLGLYIFKAAKNNTEKHLMILVQLNKKDTVPNYSFQRELLHCELFSSLCNSIPFSCKCKRK